MKPLIRAIIMSMTLLSCQDKRIKNVLFVGNSLTYYNEMPKTLQSIIDDQDVRMNVQQITFPGYFLSQHLKDSITISRINSQDWDYVVLQEATVRVLIPEIREYNFYPAIHKLDSIIKIKNGTTVLYQSYAISIYPKQYCYSSFEISGDAPEKQYCTDSLLNSNEEFEIISTSFKRLSEKTDCDIAPVGFYFELCKKKYPELNLFVSENDSHPSALGSYLIACVFFKQLTGRSLDDIKYFGGLNKVDCQKVLDIVDGAS